MGITNTSEEPSNDARQRPVPKTPVRAARRWAGTVTVLRLTAVLLALFGIFPLGFLFGRSATLEWWPGEMADCVLSVPAVVGLCLAVSRDPRPCTDRLIARGRALLLAPSPRTFALGISGDRAAPHVLPGVALLWRRSNRAGRDVAAIPGPSASSRAPLAPVRAAC